MFKEWGSCVDISTGIATLRCIPVVFQNIVAAFIVFVGAISLFLIIYSGIKFITSGGDPKQIQAARQILTYAIIGAIIILSSFAIIIFIEYATGTTDTITNIDCLNSSTGC